MNVLLCLNIHILMSFIKRALSVFFICVVCFSSSFATEIHIPKVEMIWDQVSEILSRNDQDFTDRVLTLIFDKHISLQESLSHDWSDADEKKRKLIHSLLYLHNYLHRKWYSVWDNMEWYENDELWFKILVPKKVDAFDDSEGVTLEVVQHDWWIIFLREGYTRDDLPSSWNIQISNVTDAEIQSHIDAVYNSQERYSTCTYWWIEMDKQGLYYDIRIVNEGDKFKEWCFLNYAHIDKFDPLTNKAVSWGIGQDVNFVNKYEIENKEKFIAYDSIMTSSFRFLEE